MEAFTEDALMDADVRTLTKKVSVYEDDAMTSAFPKETIATVELKLKDGRMISGRCVLPKGEPENPLSDEEAIGKFIALALYGGKTKEEADMIVKTVMNLENNLSELLKLLK